MGEEKHMLKYPCSSFNNSLSHDFVKENTRIILKIF